MPTRVHLKQQKTQRTGRVKIKMKLHGTAQPEATGHSFQKYTPWKSTGTPHANTVIQAHNRNHIKEDQRGVDLVRNCWPLQKWIGTTVKIDMDNTKIWRDTHSGKKALSVRNWKWNLFTNFWDVRSVTFLHMAHVMLFIALCTILLKSLIS